MIRSTMEILIMHEQINQISSQIQTKFSWNVSLALLNIIQKKSPVFNFSKIGKIN